MALIVTFEMNASLTGILGAKRVKFPRAVIC
ncbi:MAG: hypothetical protein ACI91K_000361, partial [Flavobacteriales bacterium]